MSSDQIVVLNKQGRHGHDGGIWDGISNCFVTVPESIFDNSGRIDSGILLACKSHRTLDARWILEPKKEIKFLTSHSQRIDVSACMIGTHKNLVFSCLKCLQC